LSPLSVSIRTAVAQSVTVNVDANYTKPEIEVEMDSLKPEGPKMQAEGFLSFGLHFIGEGAASQLEGQGEFPQRGTFWSRKSPENVGFMHRFAYFLGSGGAHAPCSVSLPLC